MHGVASIVLQLFQGKLRPCKFDIDTLEHINLYEKHWEIRMLILEIKPPMCFLEIKPPMLNSISMNLYVEFHGGIRNFHFHRSNSRQLSYIDGNEIDGKPSGFNDCIFFTRQELWLKKHYIPWRTLFQNCGLPCDIGER